MAFLLVLIVFGILILVHEAGHLIAAKRSGILVEVFSIGMGRRLFGKKIGDTDYRISLIPFGGYCKMAGEDPEETTGSEHEFASKAPGCRFWVIAAGSITNYIFAFILFSAVFMAGVPTLSNVVGQVLNGYPAEGSGIRPGDRILSINDSKVQYWEDILTSIKVHSQKDRPLDIVIERDGAVKNIEVSPDISEIKNIFGQKIQRPMLGIAPENEMTSVAYNVPEAFYHGGKKLLEYTALTYKMMWLIFTRGVPAKESLSGPIGIAFFIKQAANAGFVYLLLVMAHVSMALAVFNLLPFPVLDGGHIVFLLIEKLKGRPVDVKVQGIVTNIALFLLVSLAVFVSFNDLMKFTPLGKSRTQNTQEVSPGDPGSEKASK